MGNTQSMKKINYEDMQTVVKNPEVYLIINTLSPSEQKCLIVNTTIAEEEGLLSMEKIVMMKLYKKNINSF